MTTEAGAAAVWDATGGDWVQWLRAGRHGGNAAYAAALQPLLEDIRDRLLDHADLRPGQAIADIGCGDGFAGFGALDRIGGKGSVTFADVSPALVAAARAEAERRGVAAGCRFVTAPAQSLGLIAPESLDVVLVRAVLAYVTDKPAAFTEFLRILRPGGRISIVDPVFADRAFAIAGLARALEAEAPSAATRSLELIHRFRAAQFPATLEAIKLSPLTNYDERDLLRMLERAGFTRIHLRLHVDCVPSLPMPWEAFLASSPHAGAPLAREILSERFSPAEQREFERLMRPDLEAGRVQERSMNAYLFADRD